MQFLDLPDDVLLDIFNCFSEYHYGARTKVLKNLRLTCARFVPLVESLFYSEIRIKYRRSNLSTIMDQVRTSGRHVRELFLDLWCDFKADDWQNSLDIQAEDNWLSKLVSELPNVKVLSIHAPADPLFEYPLLTEEVGKKKIEHFTLVELVSTNERTIRREVHQFSDSIVRTVVLSSPSLRTLTVDALSVMSRPTFLAIREKAAKLEMLLFREFLGYDCRFPLSQPAPWACRDTLKVLVFYQCSGAHAGAIAAGIGNGLWATSLERLEVAKCGDESDEESFPYPLDPTKLKNTIPLKRVLYEHTGEWEINLLGQLKVKNVYLSFMTRTKAVDCLDIGLFPELEKLNVVKLRNSEINDKAIEKACRKRGVELTRDASHVLVCTCGYGEE